MAPMLSVRGVTVKFGARTIIQNLSFSVQRGENLAIIGPNGAGKSVLLHALLNLVPYEGAVEWAEDAKLGYVPQKVAADRQLPLEVKDLLSAKARLMKIGATDVRSAAERVGLTPELLSTSVGILSGGEFQKALIAFALLGNPNVLLFDEPMSSLDELTEEHVYELLRDLQREQQLTMLTVSHDLSIVYQSATNVLCLGKGTPCFGPPKEILTPQILEAVYSAPVKFHHHLADESR
ncbi:MAG TPA: metal ABC transporter ATP-binding protein [Verrucomicrobiae bacterium]|nr:metal ABC transporter ATP-binding protein [Verrucomicrobiae bacterium]